MSNGNGTANDPLTSGVVQDILNAATRAEFRAYVDQYVERGEINPLRFTSQIREDMVSYLMDREVNINLADIDAGLYDEHFVGAYEYAIAAMAGATDPIDGTHRAPSALAATWQFDVDTFDDLDTQGVLPDNIRAAGAIDYVYELGERLGVFRIADALVLNWSSGAIDVADGVAAQRLYRYLRLRDDRSTPEERGMLYKRVLFKGNTRLLDRMVANSEFSRLWNSLMSEVARYIDKTERVTEGISSRSPVSRSGIYQATRELQYNLTEHCTGMAHMQVRELYAQLQQCFDILRDEEIIAHFGGNRRKSMWTVIEYLSRQEYGEAPNIAAFRRLAVEGNTVFNWIAEFNDTPTQEQFTRFLSAAEAYILAGSVAGDGFDLPESDIDPAEDEFAEVEDTFDDDF